MFRQWCNPNDLKVNISKTWSLQKKVSTDEGEISSLDFKVILSNNEIEMETKQPLIFHVK